jgi:nitroreductase/NAD-dependent dihydropyrimidine dehydrogenase PreA subunit
MSFFNVDSKKCTSCKVCVESCPFFLLEIKEEKSVPVGVPEAEDICINCGHCVSVCPQGAFSLDKMNVDKCNPIKEDILPDFNQVDTLMKSRRSIRVFKNRELERDKLEMILDTARYAPTGHNIQLTNWIVINDKKEVNKLAGIVIDWFRYLVEIESPFSKEFNLMRFVDEWEQGNDTVMRGAPALVINYIDKAYTGAETDCAIALTYFELAAATKGIGSCWGGIIKQGVEMWPPLRQALGIPENHLCLGMMIGYPKFKYHRVPERNSLKISWR